MDNDKINQIQNSILNYIVNSKGSDPDNQIFCWNWVKNKFNDPMHIDQLQKIFNLFNIRKNITNINSLNNENRFIKMLIKGKKGKMKFIFKDIPKDKLLYIVLINGFSAKCKQVRDMKDEMEKKLNPEIIIFNIKNTPYEPYFQNHEIQFGLSNNKSKKGKVQLYCFIIVSKNTKKAEKISDFFTLISNKKLCENRYSEIKFSFYDFIIGNENNLCYYMNSFFEEYKATSKTQEFKPFFLFGLNFYSIDEKKVTKTNNSNLNIDEIVIANIIKNFENEKNSKNSNSRKRKGKKKSSSNQNNNEQRQNIYYYPSLELLSLNTQKESKPNAQEKYCDACFLNRDKKEKFRCTTTTTSSFSQNLNSNHKRKREENPCIYYNTSTNLSNNNKAFHNLYSVNDNFTSSINSNDINQYFNFDALIN
ncbi:hypothetical protein BCR36DRAFT_584684 [Piromyces finnis]|uniref:Uncharacterized protein n=1 Tax=Piromyces finnis TaxID=1754191 RepID=A0A1Y1V691_9FUNG|nr:hypothetical protein BCR36DRAFT_584684 [Piromyces finnis]|eukprot:ORX47589.1 hypothetical protein BCR36DRAFT_584684 [Piromyces finnis]